MLFTGPGRHRRPTQAEKAIAVASIAGVGLALPLMAATGAHAAPTPVWDKVAGCETGGDWTADANGYHGGLRFTDATWAAYGGTEFAASASQATRSQQIAVAERVLAAEGEGAWGTCAQQAGLSRDGVAGQVDNNDSADESGSLRGSRGAERVNAAQDGSLPAPHTTPVFSGLPGWDPVSFVYWYQGQDGGWYWTSHQDVYEHHLKAAAAAAAQQAPTVPTTTPVDPTAPVTTAPTTPTDAQGNQGGDQGNQGAPTTPTVPTTTPVDPTAPVTTAPTTPTDAQGNQGGNQGNQGSQTAPATPPAATTAPAAPATTAPATAPAASTTPAAPAPQAYTVGTGDTLSGIAADHDVKGGWSKLYDENKHVVGDNPDLIKPGQVIQLEQ